MIAQRLVRRLCDCKASVELSKELLADQGFDVDEGFAGFEPVGCVRCNHTGYRGRLGIYEVMPITDGLRKLILEKASADDMRDRARVEGMRTLREDGLAKIRDGVTSVAEVLRVGAAASQPLTAAGLSSAGRGPARACALADPLPVLVEREHQPQLGRAQREIETAPAQTSAPRSRRSGGRRPRANSATATGARGSWRCDDVTAARVEQQRLREPPVCATQWSRAVADDPDADPAPAAGFGEPRPPGSAGAPAPPLERRVEHQRADPLLPSHTAGTSRPEAARPADRPPARPPARQSRPGAPPQPGRDRVEPGIDRRSVDVVEGRPASESANSATGRAAGAGLQGERKRGEHGLRPGCSTRRSICSSSGTWISARSGRLTTRPIRASLSVSSQAGTRSTSSPARVGGRAGGAVALDRHDVARSEPGATGSSPGGRSRRRARGLTNCRACARVLAKPSRVDDVVEPQLEDLEQAVARGQVAPERCASPT